MKKKYSFFKKRRKGIIILLTENIFLEYFFNKLLKFNMF